MCGIVGIYRNRPVNSAEEYQVKKMLQIIKHRGPDATYMTDGCEHVSMGIVRLSMVDPRGSQQPIVNESGMVVVVFNGEIYNYKKLRQSLQDRGHHFSTNGDGEVIVHLYEEDPINFAQELDGMFAFALYDKIKKKLILGRDQFGIKPLYYRNELGGISFSSELKSVISNTQEKPVIDPAAIQQYLALRFIPAPGTAFKGIYKVEPGTLQIFSESGSEQLRYSHGSLRGGVYQESNDLRPTLEQAILETAQGDQDIGVLLSGGLDSSIIAAVMARHQKVQTFTVGYEIGGFQDERKFASEVASHIGSHHREVVIMDRDVPNLIDQVVWHLDEPLYTSVGLSTYVVSEFAARYVKGVMSGDGSDELLLGYKYLVDPFEKARHGLDWKKSYLSQIGWIKGVALSEILHPEILKSHNKDLSDFTWDRCFTPFEQMRWFELNKRLPDYHLVRMDRLSMAHSLEVRVPFLRKGFVEEALNLDSTELVSASHPKVLLKKSFEEMLPHHLIHRHKQPFTAPIDHWLRGVLKERVYSLFHDSSMISSIGLNPQYLRIIYQKYINGILSHELVWGIFMLLTWYDLIKKKITN